MDGSDGIFRCHGGILNKTITSRSEQPFFEHGADAKSSSADESDERSSCAVDSFCEGEAGEGTDIEDFIETES